jgi:hypothetical protein
MVVVLFAATIMTAQPIMATSINKMCSISGTAPSIAKTALTFLWKMHLNFVSRTALAGAYAIPVPSAARTPKLVLSKVAAIIPRLLLQ